MFPHLRIAQDSGREQQEHEVFQALLRMVPKLDERLVEGTTEEVQHIAGMVSRTCRAYCFFGVH